MISMKILITILVIALLLVGIVLYSPRDKECSVPLYKEKFYTIEEYGLSEADYVTYKAIRAKECPVIGVDELPYIKIPPELTL